MNLAQEIAKIVDAKLKQWKLDAAKQNAISGGEEGNWDNGGTVTKSAVESVLTGEITSHTHPASGVSITDSGEHFTSENVEGALSELFTSVSDGKDLIATAITDKGGTAAGDDTFIELADAIDNLPSGSGTYQSKTVTPDAAGQTVAPDTGYDALSQVTINGDADLTAVNVKFGVNIFGVTGTYTGSAGYDIGYYLADLAILTLTTVDKPA